MQWIRKALIVIILAVVLLPAHSASADTFAGRNGRIAFGKADGGIWTARQNGGSEQLLSERTVSDMAWSPDGTQLAFVEPQLHGSTRLRVMNAMTGTVQNVTRQSAISDSEPVWSYDGKRLAFVRTKQQADSKQSAVFTIKATGDDLVNISGWSTKIRTEYPLGRPITSAWLTRK